ncbi:MAG: hypothetical protein ACK5ML_09800 [Lachnospiraceae bacterium]
MSGINIDPSILQERSESYSSLTDLNGVNLFTDAYEERISKHKEENISNYQIMETNIFLVDLKQESDLYEQVQMQLFLETRTQNVKNVVTRSENITFAFPILIVFCLMMASLLFAYVKKKRRRWNREINTDNYEL